LIKENLRIFNFFLYFTIDINKLLVFTKSRNIEMSVKILDAVKNNLYSQLILYLKHGYNFKVKTSEGYNALMISLTIQNSERRFKMFEFLLRNDCIDVLDADEDSRNIFFWAVTKQCIQELDLLLRNHHMEINWSHTDKSGKTLLHYGVLTNNINVMTLLLKYCVKYKINVDIPETKEKLTYVFNYY
jgi:ankyrin repeat protein